MAKHNFPALNAGALVDTRDACHAYASMLGGWTTACRQRRKHWWQLSLRLDCRLSEDRIGLFQGSTMVVLS